MSTTASRRVSRRATNGTVTKTLYLFTDQCFVCSSQLRNREGLIRHLCRETLNCRISSVHFRRKLLYASLCLRLHDSIGARRMNNVDSVGTWTCAVCVHLRALVWWC